MAMAGSFVGYLFELSDFAESGKAARGKRYARRMSHFPEKAEFSDS
jgi:hypothetical protein